LKVFGNPHTVLFPFFPQTLTTTVVSSGLRNFDFTKEIGHKTTLSYSYIYFVAYIFVSLVHRLFYIDGLRHKNKILAKNLLDILSSCVLL